MVVGDRGRQWTFDTLNRAFRLLMSEPPPTLVALGTTRYWRAPEGLRLDAGAFVRALEYAAGTTAVVLGKPDPGSRVRMLGVPASKAVMVSDDVRADVQGAQHAGLSGVLVRTGRFPTPTCMATSPAGGARLGRRLPGWWSAGSGR